MTSGNFGGLFTYTFVSRLSFQLQCHVLFYFSEIIPFFLQAGPSSGSYSFRM